MKRGKFNLLNEVSISDNELDDFNHFILSSQNKTIPEKIKTKIEIAFDAKINLVNIKNNKTRTFSIKSLFLTFQEMNGGGIDAVLDVLNISKKNYNQLLENKLNVENLECTFYVRLGRSLGLSLDILRKAIIGTIRMYEESSSEVYTRKADKRLSSIVENIIQEVKSKDSLTLTAAQNKLLEEIEKEYGN